MLEDPGTILGSVPGSDQQVTILKEQDAKGLGSHEHRGERTASNSGIDEFKEPRWIWQRGGTVDPGKTQFQNFGGGGNWLQGGRQALKEHEANGARVTFKYKEKEREEEGDN